ILPKGFSRSQFPEVPRSSQNALFWLCAEASPTSVPATALKFLFRPAVSILILMGLFIASSPIERRHTRQRIAEKPSRQVARLQVGSGIAIRQRQGPGPNARREHEVSGLAAASSFIQDFGHCSFSPVRPPQAAALEHADTLAKE